MRALRDTATVVLSELLATQPTTAAKVDFAWRIAAGPAMARANGASWNADGVLVVRTPTPAWHREVTRACPMVTARLAQLLGRDVVRYIKVIEGGK
jgi:hypothetical protein